MRTLLLYAYEYIKINNLFIYLLLTLAVSSFLKYLPLPRLFSSKVLLILTLLAGLSLRIAWLNFSSHQPKMTWESRQVSENDLINLHAIDLTKGIWFHNQDGTPSGRRPIGYPLFLGGLYRLFGVRLSVAWTSHLLLFVATACLIFLLARYVFSEQVALIATFLFSVYPVSIYSVKLVTDEHLFLPVWYGGLLLLFKELSSKPVKGSWLAYGFLFGYATMIRTHTIFMPLLVGFAYFLKKQSWPRILAAIFFVGLTMQAINLPWLIRNYRIWKVPVLYTATSQFVYAQVNSTAGPEGGGHVPKRGEPDFSEELERAIQSGNEGLMHKVAGREMTHWIFKHPRQFLVLGTARLLHFMNWNRKGGVWPLWYQYEEGSYDPRRPLSHKTQKFLEECAFSFYYTVLYCTIFSVILIVSRWRSFLPENKLCLLTLVGCFLFWFLEHLVIYPIRKYRYPLEPLMMIVASYFLNFLLREFRWEGVWPRPKNASH